MESKTFTLGSELVQFYSRKSQVDFLLKSVLGHIWESQKEISLPNSFTCSLGESLSKLPGDTVIDIWIVINKEFLVHYNSDDEMVARKFELAGELMSLFLVNIAVDNVPEKTAIGINSQLKETTEYLFSHLKNKCLDQKCADDCLLVLLRILLANTVFMNLLPVDCTVKRAMQQHSDRKTESCGEFNDLSALYPQFTVKQWKKIHRLVMKTKDEKLLIVWEHLLVQGLKWCQSHATVSDSNSFRQQQQQQLCDYLILQKLEHLEIVADSEWNGELSSVTEVNYGVAFWSLLCENLSWLLPRNSVGDSSPYDTAVSRVLLTTMLLKSSSTTTDDSKNISMQEVTRRFIKSSCRSGFSGLEILQSSLLSAMLRSVSKLFNGDEETKPKRMKGHAVMDTVRRVLLLLEDAPPSDKILSDNGKVLWPSEELFVVVNELLQSTKISKGVVMDEKRNEEALNSLQILRDVLLPCMNNPDDVQSNVDHVRCLVAAFAFLAVTPFSSSLFDVCLDVALRTLTVGQGVQLLLLGVDANLMLSFVSSIADYMQQQQSGSDDLMKKADEIFGLVLRNVFRQPKSIQEFTVFIKKIISSLNNVKDKTRASTNQALRPVARLVSCMESIHRILIRSYVRPDIRPLVTQVNSTLLEEFDRLLKEFCNITKSAFSSFGKHGGSGDTAATSSEDAVIPFLLSGYVCQLDDILRHCETEGESEKDEEVNGMDGKLLEKALDMLPSLCHGCMKCLRQSKNADVVRRCLEFINFVCFHLRVTSKTLPVEFLDSVWTLLIDLLRQDLSSALSPSGLNGSANNRNDGRMAALNNETKSLEKTVAMVTSVFEMEEFERHVDLFLSDMSFLKVNSLKKILLVQMMGEYLTELRTCSSVGVGSVRAVAALRIVQELTEQSLSAECQSSFFVSCQKLLFLVQLILSNCQETHVKISILRTQTKLISLGPNFLESSELSVCLSSFADIDLEGVVDLEDFVALFNESYSMLNALLQYQETSVHKAIPTYLCVVKKLLRSIMKRSHQDAHKNIDSAQLNKLDECARLIYRLAHLMLEHKIDFAKVAPCLVAEYVTELQKGTLYPVIKQTLLMAVYQWLDICSDYATAHLHRVLPFGAKEIFGLIHEDFERYHRYKGRS